MTPNDLPEDNGWPAEQGKLGLLDWLAFLDDNQPPIELPAGAVVEALHAGRAERF